MPCHDDISDHEYDLMREGDLNKVKYGHNASNANIAMSVACELANIVEKHNLTNELSSMASIWIKEHKLRDSKRCSI